MRLSRHLVHASATEDLRQGKSPTGAGIRLIGPQAAQLQQRCFDVTYRIPTQVGPAKSGLMRVRRKEEKAPRNATRTGAAGNLRRGHSRNGAARRTQGEKILQAELADLETARSELA